MLHAACCMTMQHVATSMQRKIVNFVLLHSFAIRTQHSVQSFFEHQIERQIATLKEESNAKETFAISANSGKFAKV